MNEKILYYIWLSSIFKAGSKIPKELLEYFGTAEKIYNATKEDLSALSLSYADVAPVCNKDLERTKKYYTFCKENNVGILCYEDPYYPERLKLIPNPPPLLYYKGKLNLLDDYPCVTMVGTRSCSERGFRLAYSSAFDAASKGAVIVNGLALGIDGACIAGCLDAGGYAVGVLGCGIDKTYPYGNSDLFKRLFEKGLVISEFPPFSEPKAEHFPVRNRVISALSVATVIFEADEKSGAMITAKHALEQGKRIFAVPAKPYDKSYSGSLELIKDGASIFTEADDVLAEYSMNFPHRIDLTNRPILPEEKLDAYVARFFKKDTDPDAPVIRRYAKSKSDSQESIAPTVTNDTIVPAQFSASGEQVKKTETEVQPDSVKTDSEKDLSMLSVVEKQIYDLFVTESPLSPDEIAKRGLKIEEILSAITLLEIYGLISPLPGGRFQIAQ